MGAVNIKSGPMQGDELSAHTRWARQNRVTAGATETAICKSCHQPFLFNGSVRMPDTCGKDRCMAAAGEQTDLRVLTEGGPPPPPRTRKAPPEPAPEVRSFEQPDVNLAGEPICLCVCHFNAYQREQGWAPDEANWKEACEHCAQPA